MIFGLFRGRSNARVIERLHSEIIAAAREPALFTVCGIADNLDGRFESVALHAALVLRRLQQLPAPGPDIAQDLADTIFRHFDIGLREMGISDAGVPKRMRELAEAFLGRAAAYHEALGQDALELAGAAQGTALAAALARNALSGRQDVARLAAYAAGLNAALAQMSLVQFIEGPIFPSQAVTRLPAP